MLKYARLYPLVPEIHLVQSSATFTHGAREQGEMCEFAHVVNSKESGYLRSILSRRIVSFLNHITESEQRILGYAAFPVP